RPPLRARARFAHVRATFSACELPFFYGARVPTLSPAFELTSLTCGESPPHASTYFRDLFHQLIHFQGKINSDKVSLKINKLYLNFKEHLLYYTKVYEINHKEGGRKVNENRRHYENIRRRHESSRNLLCR